MLQDMVETFDAFSTKIKYEMLPNGYLPVINDHSVQFYYVDSLADENSAPSLLVSVVVNEQCIPLSFLSHIILTCCMMIH